ncbi:FKBP-type peptidyl-prolyl cis-trans isomerase [Schumannella luteola]
MRAAMPLLLTAGLVVSLAACSPATTTDASGCTPAPSGSSSSGVTASGDFGSKPEVDVPFPTSADATQRSVLITGDGETVQNGDTVEIEFTLYNGETGVELSSTEYAGTPTEFPVDEAQLLPGIVKTLECSTVGSRVVGVIPAIDSFGDAGSEQLGVAAGEDIVFVADIIAIAPPVEPALPRADGVDQPPTEGFPTVVLDADGRPTITIPDTAPPTDLQIAVLKKGDGAVVADGDDVTVHYVGMNWNTKVVFDESWARGEPATFNTAQVIEGFTKALVGQTVGSQVIVIIPPDYGYGSAGSGDKIGGTDTIVFVIDILGIA